jgi:DNA-3-methyladenine glycosylase II
MQGCREANLPDKGAAVTPSFRERPETEREPASMPEATFFLKPVPPFRLSLTAWAIRRRPENRMDLWEGTTYKRVLALRDKAVRISVTQAGLTSSHLRVTVAGIDLDAPTKAQITSALDRLLGRRIDLRSFYCFASHDSRLSDIVQRFYGLKPPRFPTVFEALVNGIACQQLSLAVGITLLNRLAEAWGLPFQGRDEIQYSFPAPEQLASAKVPVLQQLGFSSNKSRALIELASAVAMGRVDLERLACVDDQEAIARLLDIRGVGRWTAEYVLLRGLGRTNIFPGDDVGARSNLARWLKLRKPLDYGGVARTLAKWEPYAGLIYFHLLLDRLSEAGHVE